MYELIEKIKASFEVVKADIELPTEKGNKAVGTGSFATSPEL